MRIIVDNGTHYLSNLGDVAMLQVTVNRLARLFPGAEIHVVTMAPELLERFCPGTLPLSPIGRDKWFDAGIAMGALKSRLPGALNHWAHRAEQWIKHASPNLTVSWRKRRDSDGGRSAALMDEFVQRVDSSDLVVACGGGYITDEFEVMSSRLLGTLRLARSFGKATAMFGQGLGPARLPSLLNAMRRSLSGITAVGIRETRRGPAILKIVGVPDERVFATGDDAIEPARQFAPQSLGQDLGLNLRCVDIKNGGEEVRTEVTRILTEFAVEKQTRILPVPISYRPGDDDALVVDSFMKRANSPRHEGETDPETPQEIMQRVARCRVVITGSYHAAVFALAEGIPAVALARDEYYQDKFAGVFEQFNTPQSVVLLEKAGWEKSFRELLERAWDGAEGMRAGLLTAADDQAKRANDLYEMVAREFAAASS